MKHVHVLYECGWGYHASCVYLFAGDHTAHFKGFSLSYAYDLIIMTFTTRNMLEGVLEGGLPLVISVPFIP